MNTRLKLWLVGCTLGLMVWANQEAMAVRLGVGANYWQTIDTIDDEDFDEDGLSWIASLQFGLAEYSKIELAVEWYEAGFGGSTEDIYAPQAFFILGKGLYAGIGIGGYYTDSEFANDPFYAFRAGFDVEVLPSIYLDINANYRFENWDDISAEGSEIDTDTVTLGAAVRFEF
jgi:hypothetical protein